MLQELYEQYKDTFSKSDHKLIQYLLRNEEQLQYLTSEELSAHTGISPATVSRFWKKIGFQNLKELKIKQRIQDTATPSSRLTSALKRFEETASLTEDLKMHFGNNTAKTLDRMDPALPARAADLLLQAQHVYIYAPDASCGLASIFCYRARRLGIQPVLLEGGSAIYEYMVNITGNDLVLLFSFSRLLGETRILLDHCNKDTATPSSRLTSALKRFEETASLTEDLKMHFGNNTAKTLDRMDPALPARAADLLLQAQHVYIYAPDASCGLASIFCYRARRLGIQPVLLEGGSAIYEYMVNITGNDLVLLFSFSRLLGETRILLDHCNKINCPVILFTDLFATQEEMPSRLTFYCYRGEPNEYHSMTVPLLVLDLIILNLMQASKNSLTSSHYLEKLRAEYAQIIRR